MATGKAVTAVGFHGSVETIRGLFGPASALLGVPSTTLILRATTPRACNSARTLHEGDSRVEPYFDCPSCSAPATVTQVVEEGRCSGALDAEVAESYADDTALRDTGCRAKPALEMVWKA